MPIGQSFSPVTMLSLPDQKPRDALYTPYNSSLSSNLLFQSFCKIVRGMDRHQISVKINYSDRNAYLGYPVESAYLDKPST